MSLGNVRTTFGDLEEYVDSLILHCFIDISYYHSMYLMADDRRILGIVGIEENVPLKDRDDEWNVVAREPGAAERATTTPPHTRRSSTDH
jgi:hypothetical protein